MCGEFDEVSGIIDPVINFLAAGTLFLNSYDTLSYTEHPARYETRSSKLNVPPELKELRENFQNQLKNLKGVLRHFRKNFSE